MKVNIQTIPHKDQRYDTAGDWVFDADGNLTIFVSDVGDWRYEMLVAFHEFAEVLICKQKCISQSSVDTFDQAFEGIRINYPEVIGDMEPGNMTSAPYHDQHVFATSVEQMLAKMLDVDWKTYDDAINNL